MLKFTFNPAGKFVNDVEFLFTCTYEVEWFDDPFIKEMVEDLEQAEIVSNTAFKYRGEDTLQFMSDIKTSTKALILLYRMDVELVLCGAVEDYFEWLLKIAEKKDVSVALPYYFKPKQDFDGFFIDAAKSIHSVSEFCSCHLPYLDSPAEIRVTDAENLLKQLKSSVSRKQCEYAADAAYKLAEALQLNPQCAKELSCLYGVGEIMGSQEAYEYLTQSGYPSSAAEICFVMPQTAQTPYEKVVVLAGLMRKTSALTVEAGAITYILQHPEIEPREYLQHAMQLREEMEYELGTTLKQIITKEE